MSTPSAAPSASCSFCAKDQSAVVRLVAGIGAFICNECVALCEAVISADVSQRGAQPSRGTAQVRTWSDLDDDTLLEETARAHGAHANVDQAVARHVAELRARGVSWARIGEALGMTRQSAWERFSGEE